MAVIASGLMVRDAGRCPAPHHEGLGFAAKRLLILRSPPQAGVSKDGLQRTTRTGSFPYAIALPLAGSDASAVICPSVQPHDEKYFRSPATQITTTSRAVLCRWRGGSRSSRTFGTRCDGRGGARRRGAPIADGEVVEAWRPR